MITGNSITVNKTHLEEILPFRQQFLQEINAQVRYDACHVRNWSDSYLLSVDGRAVGYGSVKGKEELPDRDAIFEFYLLPHYRKWTGTIFTSLVEVSGATFMECQSNDPHLSALLYEFCPNIHSEVILFADCVVTDYQMPEVTFRRRKPEDDVFGKHEEDAGDYVLEKEGTIVATGGFLTHYNQPFADLYMEVKSDARNQGLGSFLLQEIKKECYRAGRVPAARCNMNNKASRSTLIKAGFRICGFMLNGELKSEIEAP